MKKLSLFIFITFFLTSVMIAIPQGFAHAQEPVCTDTAGGVIPCPATVEIPCGQAGGPACPPTAEIPCGQVGGPACPATENRPNPTPRPTKTPFPLANPTQETVNAGASWSGSCENAGPVNDPCLLTLVNACFDAGGDSTVGNPDDNGTVTVTCALPAVRDPNAPLPLVAASTRTPLPDENYLGSCTNEDRNVFDCFEKFKCEDGLLVIKVDLYSGNGTKYDFYCIPDESVPQLDLPLTIPDPIGKDANWTGGCDGGAGLDACLDLMSAGCADEGGEVSIWYDDDGAGVYCQNESEAGKPATTETPAILAAPQDPPAPQPEPKPSTPWGPLGLGAVIGAILISLLLPAVQKVREAAARQPSGRMPNNKHPELVKNKPDDGGTEAAYMKLGDIKGESHSTQPKSDDK